MLDVITEPRKEGYTILVLTKIYLKSLLFSPDSTTSDTTPIPCRFSFGQVTVTVVTANYLKQTHLAVILEDL